MTCDLRSLRRDGRFAWVVIALQVAFLAFPSANYHVFTGLPFGRAAKFAGLVILLPLIASSRLRRAYMRQLARLSRGRAFAVVALLVGLALKAALLGFGGYEGFLACYGSSVEPTRGGFTSNSHWEPQPGVTSEYCDFFDVPVGRTCESSYDNPFGRFGVTRIDRRLDFDERTWNLSFFNSARLNTYSARPGGISRFRVPFHATYRARIERPQASTLTVTYTGGASLSFGTNAPVELPEWYGEARTVRISFPPGQYDLLIRYVYDDGYRGKGDEVTPPPGEYAKFVVRDDASGAAFSGTRAGIGWRIVGVLVDVLQLLALGSIAWLYARLVRRDAWIVAVVGVGVRVVWSESVARLTLTRPLDWTFRPLSMDGWPAGLTFLVVAIALLALALVPRHRLRRLLLAYFALIALTFVRPLFWLNGPAHVLLRAPGDDWLMYESLARTVFDGWILEGGERIFFYQPLFRYIRLALHLLFGDGDVLPAVLSHAALNFGVFYLLSRLASGRRTRGGLRVLAVASGILLVALVNTEAVLNLVYVGASEYPTWIAALFVIPMVARSRPTVREWTLAAILLVGSLLTRTNQAVAIAIVMVPMGIRLCRSRPRLAMTLAALSAVAISWPAAHNLYYGHTLVLFTNTVSNSKLLLVTPASLLGASFGHDPTGRVASQLSRSLGAILMTAELKFATPWLPTIASYWWFRLSCLGLQLVWIAAMVTAVRFRRRLPIEAWLLLLVPLADLVVFFFYDARSYLPRHIVIAYIWAAVAAIQVARYASRPGVRGSDRCPGPSPPRFNPSTLNVSA